MRKYLTVHCDGYEIETVTTNESAIVDQWLRRVYGRYKYFGAGEVIVGLDIEWKPNQMPQVPRTMQLCVGKKCIVIQLPMDQKCHTTLLDRFVRDRRFVFAGVQIKADIEKIMSSSHLKFHDWGLDLVKEAKSRQIDCDGRYGLQSLALNIGNLDFVKDRDMARSDWGAENLSNRQIEYAARDAFVSFHIAKILKFYY